MIDWIISFFLVSGSMFMLIAAIGVVRLPDIYLRIHASTKAASLGALLMLIALSISLPTFIVIVESIMIVFFLFLTAPVGSHMIARVAHMMQVKQWDGTLIDELQEQKDRDSQAEKNPES
jgi:multicomponent Na+:H+ antiporter subunit G